MDEIEISHGTISGKQTTSFCIGEASGDLPRHLMTGEKACGYIVGPSGMETWYWDSLKDRNGRRYIDGPRLDILPFSEITRSLRPRALVRLRELAQAFGQVPTGFIQPSQGFVETWRIYFLKDSGVLLLPDQLSQVMLYSVSEEVKFNHVGRYMKPNTEPPFGLCHQFTQFLYLASAGFAPYDRADVREDSYRHIPLSLGFSGIDADLSRWIDATLSMPPKEQRLEVSAAYSAEDNLSWWLEKTAVFTWTVPTGPTSVEIWERQDSPVLPFIQQQQKRADRRRFWRKRGALVATVALGVLIVLSILIGMVYRAVQPPYTAGMGPQEVIQEFFNAQNELDLTKMGASLARGVKNPFEMEVSSLFVNTKVRQAYEGFDFVVRADKWLAEQRPDIPESSIVYGVVDVEVTPLDTSRYRASYLVYFPAENTMEDALMVDIARRTTDFLMTDSKGYWQIEEIAPLGTSEVDTIRIQTFPRFPQALE